MIKYVVFTSYVSTIVFKHSPIRIPGNISVVADLL